MNAFYNTQQSKDTLALMGKATQTAVNSALNLLEKQVEFARGSADRNLSRALAMPQFASAEEALKFQKEAGETELAELRKAGEACYEVADNAGREFVTVAKEGRQLVEASISEAAANAASVLPNGKAGAFSDAFENSLKLAGDLAQNTFDAAVQAVRAGADSVAQGQRAVATQVQGENGKRAASKK